MLLSFCPKWLEWRSFEVLILTCTSLYRNTEYNLKQHEYCPKNWDKEHFGINFETAVKIWWHCPSQNLILYNKLNIKACLNVVASSLKGFLIGFQIMRSNQPISNLSILSVIKLHLGFIMRDQLCIENFLCSNGPHTSGYLIK